MRIIIAGLVLIMLLSPSDAGAAWVKPNKRPVSRWEGFTNSVDGAVTNVMPWNWGRWMGRQPSPKRKGYVHG